MFDTHCHLNFKVFEKDLGQVVADAKKAGVDHIVVPGTDVESSKRAVEIAEEHEGVYAAVGIHPHHIFKFGRACLPPSLKLRWASAPLSRLPRAKSRDRSPPAKLKTGIFAYLLNPLIDLLKNKKVAAVGEVGVDRYYYEKTKYINYKVNEEFINLQKNILIEQIELAKEYDKSLILHNRQAADELLQILDKVWDKKLDGRTVFHCCEPEDKLLNYAIDHKIFIGVDGDITYKKKKQEFIKKVPLELLVLETDSPYMVPRINNVSIHDRPNKPKNIKVIAEFISNLLDVSINQLIDTTTENAKRLFLM